MAYEEDFSGLCLAVSHRGVGADGIVQAYEWEQ